MTGDLLSVIFSPESIFQNDINVKGKCVSLSLINEARLALSIDLYLQLIYKIQRNLGKPFL